MKSTPKIAVAALIVASALAQQTAHAQFTGFSARRHGKSSTNLNVAQRRRCNDHTHQDACRSCGWRRARNERLRQRRYPHRERDTRCYAVRRHRERAGTQDDRRSSACRRDWPKASSGPSTGSRTVASHRCSVRAPSPRASGTRHVIVDDLPWWWADASDNNTVDIAWLPSGEHKVTIALVDANHNVIPGQVVTVPFTVPASAPTQHLHVAN